MFNNAARQSKRQCIEEMSEFLQAQSTAILEYDEKMVRRLVKKITFFQ
jgi:site-specific DNA recombinase